MRPSTVFTAVAAAAASVLLVVPAVASTTASSCSDSKQTKKVDFKPDPSRVRASCSALDNNKKAQGFLDLTLAPDPKTQWFTTLNKNYYSGYDAGPNNGTGHRIVNI